MKTPLFSSSFLALSLVLLFAFLAVYPVVLLGAKPFLVSFWQVLLELAQGKGLSIPFHFTVKGLAFALLGVGSLTLLRLRLEVAYLSHWSLALPRPHSLHVDYNPREPESVYALGRWGLYQFLQITALPLGILCVMGVSFYLQVWFLNTFLEAPFMDFPLIYMIGIFFANAINAQPLPQNRLWLFWSSRRWRFCRRTRGDGDWSSLRFNCSNWRVGVL